MNPTPEKLCVIGNARVKEGNPITHLYSSFFITFIVDSETGTILDAEASMTLGLTRRFVRDLLSGRSLADVDESLIQLISCCYLGSSQKAMCVAYRDAVKKYRAWRQGLIITE